jgi:hypothetical protein
MITFEEFLKHLETNDTNNAFGGHRSADVYPGKHFDGDEDQDPKGSSSGKHFKSWVNKDVNE